MHAPSDAAAEPPVMVAAFQLVRRYRKWILLTSIVVIAIAVAVSIAMTPVYRSEILVAYSATQQTDQPLSMLASRLGGLASFAGIGASETGDSRAEAIATLKSRTLSLQFIERNGLMPVLFADKWDAAGKKWKVDPEDVPTPAEAFKRFDEDVRDVSDDTTTGLLRVSILGTDREQVAAWANALVRDANQFLRERTLDESRKGIAQLQRVLASTNAIEIRQVIFGLMETQLSNATLASSREDYAFRVIDAAVVPDADDYERPKPILFIALACLLGPLLGFVLALLRESWSQSR